MPFPPPLHQYLADIEEHLGVTIQQVDREMKVPVNEFDGKVVYGEKRGYAGGWLVTSGEVCIAGRLEIQ